MYIGCSAKEDSDEYGYESDQWTPFTVVSVIGSIYKTRRPHLSQKSENKAISDNSPHPKDYSVRNEKTGIATPAPRNLFSFGYLKVPSST